MLESYLYPYSISKYMLTLKPLRSAIAGLSIFAGMASAQAALTITFEQDDNTGYLNIRFDGEQAIPSLTMHNPGYSLAQFGFASATVHDSTGYLAFLSNWTRSDPYPWANGLNPVVSFSGTGGINSASPTWHEIFSSTDQTDKVTWNGISTYVGTLESIGLADRTSGVISFVNDADSFSIEWNAIVIPAVPEPATYALVLGLGVAGVALLRRRTRS